MSVLALLAVLQTATSPAPSVVTPSSPTEWATAAQRDIEAGYALMRDNHPGFVLAEDKVFKSRLESARKAGLEAAGTVDDQSSYAAALESFSYELGDGHALLIATGETPSDAPARWPGFMTAWRGNAMYIVDGEAAPGLGAGSRIDRCDGTPVAELLVKRLGGGRVRLQEQGEWWAYGTAVLLDDPARVRGPVPRSCDIVPPSGGAPQAVTLTYSPQPDDMMARYWKAANGGYTDIGLTEPRAGLFLIGMPTFDNSATATKMYAALDAEIDKRHAELEKARAVVIDLRYNQGGSSAFPESAAQHLWGRAAVDTRRDAANRAVEIWWRNSPGNVDHVYLFEKMFLERGQPDAAKEYRALADRMKAGAAKGEPFTNQEPADLSKPAPVPAPVKLRRPVYVIVPGQCASACLDALDFFSMMPDVTWIGAPTAADSAYMEIREVKLPSGQGEAVIPTKVWMNRPRGGGEIYLPHLPMRQADWSTYAFLDAIDADLSKRAATR